MGALLWVQRWCCPCCLSGVPLEGQGRGLQGQYDESVDPSSICISPRKLWNSSSSSQDVTSRLLVYLAGVWMAHLCQLDSHHLFLVGIMHARRPSCQQKASFLPGRVSPCYSNTLVLDTTENVDGPLGMQPLELNPDIHVAQEKLYTWD